MSVALIKMYYNHIDRLFVEDPAAVRQQQRTADCATHNLTRNGNMDRNSNLQMLTEKRRSQIHSETIYICLKNKVTRNKYYHVIFLVHGHN